MKFTQESLSTTQKLIAVGALAGSIALNSSPATAETTVSPEGQSSKVSPEMRAAKQELKKTSRAAIKHYTKDLLAEESRTGLENDLSEDKQVLTVTTPIREGVPAQAFVYHAEDSQVTIYESTKPNPNDTTPHYAFSALIDLPDNDNIVYGHMVTGQEVTGSEIASVLSGDNNFLKQVSVMTKASSRVRTVVFRHGQTNPLYTEATGSQGNIGLASVSQVEATTRALQHADNVLSAQTSEIGV